MRLVFFVLLSLISLTACDLFELGSNVTQPLFLERSSSSDSAYLSTFTASFNTLTTNYSLAYDGTFTEFTGIADVLMSSGSAAGNDNSCIVLLESGPSSTAGVDGVDVLRWPFGLFFDIDALAYDQHVSDSIAENGYFVGLGASDVNSSNDPYVEVHGMTLATNTLAVAKYTVGALADSEPRKVVLIVPAKPSGELRDAITSQATGCSPAISSSRLDIRAMSVSALPAGGAVPGRLLVGLASTGNLSDPVDAHPGNVNCIHGTSSLQPVGEDSGDPAMFAYGTVLGFSTTDLTRLAHRKIVALSNDYVRDELDLRFILPDHSGTVIYDIFAFDDGSYAVTVGFIGYMSFPLTGSSERVVLLSNSTDLSVDDDDDDRLPQKFALIHFNSLDNDEVRYAVEFLSDDGYMQGPGTISAQADDPYFGMLVSFYCVNVCEVRGLFVDSVAHFIDSASMKPSAYPNQERYGAAVMIVNGEPEWSIMVSAEQVDAVDRFHAVALQSGQSFGIGFESLNSATSIYRKFSNGSIASEVLSGDGDGNAIVLAMVDYDGLAMKVAGVMTTASSPGPNMQLRGLSYSDLFLRGEVSPDSFDLGTDSLSFDQATQLPSFSETYMIGISVDVSDEYRSPRPSDVFSPLNLENRPALAPLEWPVEPTPAPPAPPQSQCTSGTECVAGTRCAGDLCFPCEPGQFTAAASYATVCNLCPPGFYQDTPGSNNCSTPCPADRTSDAGARDVSECYCDNDHYDLLWEWGDYPQFNLSSTCIECPSEEVAECPRNEPPFAKPGYFKFFNLTLLDDETGTPQVAYIACIPEIACEGNNTCRLGYDGVGCAECDVVANATEDGGDQVYYRLNGNCFKCNQNLNVIFLMSIAAIVFLITLYMFLRYKWILGAASIKLGISFIQLTALLGNIKNMWPPQVLFIFAVLSTINFNIEVLGPECFDDGAAEGGYFHVWKAKMIFPMVIFAVLIGLSQLFAKIGMTTVGKVMFRLLMQLLNIMYLFLATTVLQFFDCTTYRDGFAVMDASASTPCFEGEWTDNLPFAIFGLLVWVMGIPIAFAVLLFNLKRHALLRDHKTLLENEYLIGHFKTRAFWWTLVDLATKIVLLMVQLFFSSQLLLQLVFSVMIMLAVIVAHVWYKPYIWSMNNRLSIMLFFNLIILLLFGVIFSSSEDGLNDTLTTVLTTIIALIIAASIVSIIYTVFKETSIRRKNGGHTWTEADFLREDRKLGLSMVGEGGGTGGGIKDEPWYFSFDREEAETYLLDHPKVRFLVRPSSRFGCYTLSYLEDNKFKHSIIERTENNRFRLPPQTKEYDTVNELLVDQPSLMEAAEAAGGDHYDDVSELKKLPLATTEVQLPKPAASPAPSARSSAVTGPRTSMVASASAAGAMTATATTMVNASSGGSRTSAVAAPSQTAADEADEGSSAQTPKEAALAQLATLAYWRPDADRKAAEAELGEAEEDVGVVRPSRKANAFAVTYRSEGSVHHTVIECRRLGLCIVDNEGDEQIFKTFDDALSFLHVEGKI